MSRTVTAADICRFLGSEDRGGNVKLHGVSSLRDAQPGLVVFAAKPEALALAVASPAGLILAAAGMDGSGDSRVVEMTAPRQAFALVYREFFQPERAAMVHLSAVTDGALLAPGCRVDAGAVVGDGVEVGEGCWIGPRAVLLPGTRLGQRVRVQAGAVLGADGFGYVPTASGYVQFPQVGRLDIGDDVEIGAGTTIDRGALEETRIGRGTKIDNLVHIAHNCRVGEDVLIAAQVGVAGSSTLGDRAIVGGQVGIGEHVWVGPDVILGAQAGVPSHKRLEGAGQVFWGTPARPIASYLRDLARLRRGR